MVLQASKACQQAHSSENYHQEGCTSSGDTLIYRASACRFALGHIIDKSLALVEYLREKGPKTVHNMDTLLLRESMDVIGE